MHARGLQSASALPERRKPLKRPAQARAKFTVQAIYDAFVRLWQRDGWSRVTTRAVALETGISVGTLYEYFPNKHALLAGYVRHAIESLLIALNQRPMTVERAVRLLCDPRAEGLPGFDAEMIDMEHEIVVRKDHRRVYDVMLAAWRNALASAGCRADDARIETLFVAAWGGRRYLLRAQPVFAAERWIAQMQAICATALTEPPPPALPS
ncbi:TetR/AcrR family transcriptional regulator [Aquincola sp. S2]|uniref:TetR/AcrR family transcriptional regulator n=1 Tax=Pseudaquabacterium terrae TaxID=2732868 RepID=A0ABX2EGC0_9BURK|nr:TetR/AcrR family transcriptional regulator [Aquabacterium terrae]NRF67668.1 TetR/AcrR family transcriptional regulator [Aquabacterium terrae]